MKINKIQDKKKQYFCFVIHTKNIILSLLILFTFVGNIGFSVFTHSCEEDGVFRSYFVQLQDHCEDKSEEVLPACCQKEQEKGCGDEQINSDCCNDQIDVYKVNMDYFSDYKVSIPDLIFIDNAPLLAFYSPSEKVKQYNPEHYIHPPPNLSGREILIRNQVFRI